MVFPISISARCSVITGINPEAEDVLSVSLLKSNAVIEKGQTLVFNKVELALIFDEISFDETLA